MTIEQQIEILRLQLRIAQLEASVETKPEPKVQARQERQAAAVEGRVFYVEHCVRKQIRYNRAGSWLVQLPSGKLLTGRGGRPRIYQTEGHAARRLREALAA